MIKIIMAALLLLFAFEVNAWAAIAIDSTLHATFASGASATQAFNNVAGNCMAVSIHQFDSPGNISGVTYNGVAMTAAAVGGASGNQDERVAIYVLASPATGSHNLVVSFSPNNQFGGDLIISSYSGCNTGSLLGNTAVTGDTEISGQSSPMSLSISMTSGSVAVSGIYSNQTFAFTDGSGQTSIFEGPDLGSSERIAGSYKVDATAMSYSWTGGSRRVAMAVVELKAAAGGGGSTPVRHKVTISWNDNSDNEDRFEIWRNQQDGPNGNYALLASVPQNFAQYEDDMDGSLARTFCYRIKGCNAAGCSPFSNYVCDGWPNLPVTVEVSAH